MPTMVHISYQGRRIYVMRGSSVWKAWAHHHLIKRDGPLCQLCYKPFEPGELVTLDHITPRAAGGRWHLANLMRAHQPCNEEKGVMSLAEWRAQTGT